MARKPSWWWLGAAAACIVLAAAAAAVAFVVQREASRPVGEGELFRAEAQRAAALVWAASDGGRDLDEALRRARNRLAIEAIAVVDSRGRFVASTSDGYVGDELHNGLLRFGLAERRFAAVAAPLVRPLTLDGVEEWAAGDTVYEVLQPMSQGDGLLLYYDLAELLQRRLQDGDIRASTLQLGGIALFFVGLAALLVVGRARARRRYLGLARESEFLRRQSAELERHNAELDEARRRAEVALALVEEKNRIRAEFVLMINHELRTPLTTMVTGAELLRSATLDAAERRLLLDDMVRDGSRLQEMISQMLAVARIENRGLEYTLRDVPLLEACAHVEATQPRIDVTAAHPDPAAVVLHTDPQTLASLIGSLTDNAYTHGARRVVVTCAADVDFEPMIEVGSRPELAVFFTVVDDGPGIDPDFLPRAFEKFEKHSRSSGTGLGLYVARMMVEAMEASLAVTTSPQGTTMAVAVPLATVMETVSS